MIAALLAYIYAYLYIYNENYTHYVHNWFCLSLLFCSSNIDMLVFILVYRIEELQDWISLNADCVWDVWEVFLYWELYSNGLKIGIINKIIPNVFRASFYLYKSTPSVYSIGIK